MASEKICATADFTNLEKARASHVSVSEDDLKTSKYAFEYFSSKMVRFYADFDLKHPMTPTEFTALRVHANQVFRGLSQKGYVYTDGSYDTGDKRKLSFHIINKNIMINRFAYSWKCEYGKYMLNDLLGEFFQEMNIDGKTVYPRMLFEQAADDAVYGSYIDKDGEACARNNSLRLPWATTKDKPHPHVPKVDTGDISDYFVGLCSGAIHPLMAKKTREWENEKNTQIGKKETEQIKRASIPEEEKEPVDLEKKKKDMLELLAMVKKERFKDYKPWRTLARLMKLNKLGVKLFCQYSKESGYSDYSEEDCLEEWSKIKDDEEQKPGFPTIHKWLEEDGVDWKKMVEQDGILPDLLKAIKDYGELVDKAVADIFYKYYNDSLYFTPCGWIHFHEKRGWELGNASSIIYPMMTLLGDTLLQYIKTLKQQDGEEDKDFKKRKTHIQKECNKISTHNKCVGIVKIAETLFKNDNILLEFDSKPNWFCFSNFKAIDMETGDIVPITKQDKIITTCGYPLPERLPEDVEEAEAFIRTFVEKETFDSYMSMVSSNFCGDPNKNQRVYIHTGLGGNGKSLAALLLRMALGNYASVLPIEQLTRDSKGRDDANGSLAQMRGKRYAQFNEPEDCKETTLKVARVKELTGETTVKVRELYGKPFDMKISFTVNIFCNEKPKMSKSDGGIERRLAVFPYVFSFVDEPDESDPYQKLKDVNLSKKVETDINLRNGFLYLCLDHWKKNQGRFICGDNVKEANKEYLLENNPLTEWFGQYEESADFIRSKELKDEYEQYAKTEITTTRFNVLLSQLTRMVADTKKGNKFYIQKKKDEKQDFSKPQK